MDFVLSQPSFNWQFAHVYLDGIFIFSVVLEQHFHNVWKALSVPENVGVALKLKKFWLFTESIDYFGCAMRPWQSEFSSRTTGLILGLKPLTVLVELQSFLDSCNVFGPFVSNFAKLLAPLSQKLKKDQPTTIVPLYEWKIQSMKAFKDTCMPPPALA